MTDVWRVLMFGYRSTQKQYAIYNHEVIVHANEFVDAVQRQIDTERTEGFGGKSSISCISRAVLVEDCLLAICQHFNRATATNNAFLTIGTVV